MLIIALPWYFAAEAATPGFLDYFIVGEHFNRFLVSGWQGDLYGTAHDEPRGTIWLFWLYSAAPWSIVLPIVFWLKRKKLGRDIILKDGIFSFLVCWMLAPMLLFTFSGNILPAYVLPGVPAIGMLMAILLSDVREDKKWFKVTAGILPCLLIAAVIYIQLGVGDRKSDKVIFRNADPQVVTYYVGNRPFSGQFYSHGQAKQLTDSSVLIRLDKVQLIGEKSQVEQLVKEKKMSCAIDFVAESKRALYRCDRSS